MKRLLIIPLVLALLVGVAQAAIFFRGGSGPFVAPVGVDQAGNVGIDASGNVLVGFIMGAIPPPQQQIVAVTQFTSATAFQANTPNAVVGTVSVTMSPPSIPFSGTLTVTGANSCGIHLIGNTVYANATSGCSATGGPHSSGLYDDWNVVATQAGVIGSPFTQAEAATATSGTPPLPQVISTFESRCGAGAGATSMTCSIGAVYATNSVQLSVGWCAAGSGCSTGTVAPPVTVTATDSAGNTIGSAVANTSTNVPTSAPPGPYAVAAWSFPITHASAGDTVTINFSSSVDYPVADGAQSSNTSGVAESVQVQSASSTLSLPVATTGSNEFIYSAYYALNCPTINSPATVLTSNCSSNGMVNASYVSGAAGNYPQGANVFRGDTNLTGVAFAVKYQQSTSQIASLAVGNGGGFPSPFTGGVLVGPLTATCTAGDCSTATFTLATTGACSGATGNSSFAISGSNLRTGSGTVNPGSYSVGVNVHVAGATDQCFPLTLTGWTVTSITPSTVSLSDTQTTPYTIATFTCSDSAALPCHDVSYAIGGTHPSWMSTGNLTGGVMPLARNMVSPGDDCSACVCTNCVVTTP